MGIDHGIGFTPPEFTLDEHDIEVPVQLILVDLSSLGLAGPVGDQRSFCGRPMKVLQRLQGALERNDVELSSFVIVIGQLNGGFIIPVIQVCCRRGDDVLTRRLDFQAPTSMTIGITPKFAGDFTNFLE